MRAPTLTTARVAGSTLTLDWNEPLDTNSVPATSAFTVTVNGARQGIAGIAVAGEVVILTLATAAKSVDTLTVSYSPPSQAGSKAIQDVGQNEAAAFSGRAVTNETVVEVVSITISSDPGADGTYTYGSASGRTPETIEATVTFSENVTVTGTPKLPVKLQVGVGVPPGTPGQDVGRPSLVYHSGSDTASLTFRRVVKEGDSNPDGIRIWAGEIELDRGTIKGKSGRNAVLTHEGLAAQSGHRVDGVQPTLWGATRSYYDVLTAVGGSAAVNGNTITLLYNEALDETKVPTPGYGFEVWVGGTRNYSVVNGGIAQTVSAVAMNGRKVMLTLASPVAPDADVRIDYVVPYYRRSAAITDSAGNQARNFYSDVIDNVTAASSAASVDALALASSPGSDLTYTIGDEIDVRATYSTSVTVNTASGTPTLNIEVGSEIRPAAYIAGSGTQELTFRYTVAEDDADSDGLSISSGHIAVNGGMIGSGSPRVAAARTHTGLAAQVGHLVDGERPRLSSGSVDGTTLTLNWNEPLDTTSVPATFQFPIYVNGRQRGTGAIESVAVSGSTVTLTLSSIVAPEDTVGVTYRALTLANATPVRDAPGNAAVKLGNVAAGRIGMTVTNETTGLPAVSIAASTTPVTEGTAAAFTLSRTGATDAELTVEVSVTESGAALSVATEDDEAVEDSSTVTATVSSGTGYTVDGASGSADVVAEDDDAAPVVTTASPIAAAENATAVVTLTATDEDTAAEGLSWSIPAGEAGGADGAKFALTAGGELTFGSAKDFEAPDDADTDGAYEVTVRVTDGSNPVDAALVVRLSDVDDTVPTLSSATVDGDALTLTFSEALDGDSEPPASSFAVTVAGSARTVDAVAVSGKVVTLTLSSAVVSGETVTVGYTVPTGADATPVKDAAGNSVATFASAEVTNETAALPVVSIAASTTPVTEGTAAAFTLSRTGATDAELTVEVSVSESEAALSGTPPTQVTFAAGSASATLSVATEDDEAVEDSSTVTATVSSGTGYTVDGASGSADVVAEDDDAAPVVTTASPIEAAENATAVVTLTATDEDTAAEGLSWSIPAGEAGGADGAKFVLTTGGVLTFGSATDFEAPDDADSNGEYEVTVRVTDGANPVDAALVVRLSDVDEVAPTLSSASVYGDELTLTFSEVLDGDSVPPASSFAVTVVGSARTVDAVAVSGSLVTLMLSSTVTSGETVTVGYTVPTGADAKPIRDTAGNAAGTFADAQATNTTPQIAGVAQVGNTLGVSFAEAPSGTVTYQWLRGSEVIAGATASTYAPAAADVGKRLSVRVESGGASLTSASTVPVWPAPVNPALADGEEELHSTMLTLGSWDGFPLRIAGYGRVLGTSFGEMDDNSFEDGDATHAVDLFAVNSIGHFGIATGATLPETAGLVVYWNGHRISGLEVESVGGGTVPVLVGRTSQPKEEYLRYTDGTSDGVRVAVSLRRVSVVAQEALTAKFKDLPAQHSNTAFTFEIEIHRDARQ